MSVAPGLIVDRADLCAKMLEELLQRHEKSGLLALHFFKQCTGVSLDKHLKGRQRFLVTAAYEEVHSLVFLEGECDLTRAIGLEERANQMFWGSDWNGGCTRRCDPRNPHLCKRSETGF
jgi:hypothetical protein